MLSGKCFFFYAIFMFYFFVLWFIVFYIFFKYFFLFSHDFFVFFCMFCLVSSFYHYFYYILPYSYLFHSHCYCFFLFSFLVPVAYSTITLYFSIITFCLHSIIIPTKYCLIHIVSFLSCNSYHILCHNSVEYIIIILWNIMSSHYIFLSYHHILS